MYGIPIMMPVIPAFPANEKVLIVDAKKNSLVHPPYAWGIMVV